jgi:cytochrome c oxidase accessory protein FixG
MDKSAQRVIERAQASSRAAMKRVIPIEPATDEIALYEIRKKIHPRSVHGWFAGWRIAFVVATQLVFYGMPWLTWNGRQAVVFDLGARKFYIFGALFWPQDVIYLAVILIAAALSLFLFTAVAGRLWCGFACPQTVYTEIFMWIERRIEGERLARLKLDDAPMSPRKLALRTAKHAAWLAVALWTGYTFVGYFTPIRALGVSALSLRLGPWETFWILFYSLATYGNAGWLREQVCKYMCPYARFQSVMFDKDTLVITYDRSRGEPRGGRAKSVDPRTRGLGDCVDCGICVQVCPTGIDIRQGLQFECIGCAACIDGCNQVMDKMGYARGLIRYTTENALEHGFGKRAMWKRAMRPRTLVYAGVLAIIVSTLTFSLATRNPLRVDVIRDRGALAREAAPGRIENVYRLQIINGDEKARRFTIDAAGLPGIEVVGITQPVDVDAASTRLVPLRLQASLEGSPAPSPGSHKIELTVRAIDEHHMIRHEPTTFIVPR